MADLNPRTDHDILTKHAYATDEHLAVRYRIHELYSKPKIDFQQWVVGTFNWRGNEQVLDIGAGSGSYFYEVHRHIPQGNLIAGDLSIGMAKQARTKAQDDQYETSQVLTLDAQHLPFPADSFDVVLANHMLYHVPDLKQTIREIHRVLRPEGCLIAATNSQNTMPEFDTLTRRACTLLGFPRQGFRPDTADFSLESGTRILGKHFRAVARYDLPSAFHFPDVKPVMDYLDSLRAVRERQLPDTVTWEEFMEKMEDQISRLIGHFGELQVSKLAGVLVATDGGGFAAEYLKQFNGIGA
jgi:SAM-dependent methyltransferase